MRDGLTTGIDSGKSLAELTELIELISLAELTELTELTLAEVSWHAAVCRS